MAVPPRSNGVKPRFFQPPKERASADADFAWPPRAEDLAACSIVPLGDDMPTVPDWGSDVPDTPAGDPGVVATPRPDPGRPAPKTPAVVATRKSRPRQPDPDPLSLFAPDPGEAAADPWLRSEIARAAAALFVGVSLAMVSYSQFRGTRHASAASPVAIEQTASAASSLDLPASAIASPDRPHVGNGGLALLRGTSFPERPAMAARAPAPVVMAAVAVPVRAAAPYVDLSSRATPEPPAPRPVDDSRVEMRALPTAPVAMADVTPAPAPEPIATVARLDPARDEDRIRTTLAQWRTAYSQLDANAAHAVWPSVDVRALERAFQGLKSQELSFDHCDFTVNGTRAQAACTGRAVYVPRVGNPSPKTNTREWKFELTQSDQRWTIASARSS